MHPFLLDLGFFKLPSYGLMVAIGFALAIYYSYKNVGKSGVNISGDQILSIATFLIIFAMLGARLFYVIQYWADFNGDWAAILMLTQREGFVFYGGFIAGLLYLIWYCANYKLSFWKFMDLVIPGAALGYGIGRIGCFLNGCCYGAITKVPWAVIFPHHPGELHHPTQLYEAIFGILLFVALYYWNTYHKKFFGQTFLLGTIAYSVERFMVEFIRTNIVYAGLTAAQWIALLCLFIALYFYYLKAQVRALNK